MTAHDIDREMPRRHGVLSNPDLRRRIAVTLGVLVVYRLATLIPLPGIDMAAWRQLADAAAGALLGQANALSGGAVGRLAIVALGVLPFITAAVLLQLVAVFSRRLSGLSRAGSRGRGLIDRATRVITVVLAALQAYGIAIALEGVSGLVSAPAALFRVSTVLTLTAGTMLAVWLADQITLRGIGNGLALILFTNIAVEVPGAILSTLIFSQAGILSPRHIAAVAAIAIALVVFAVVMERAELAIAVRYRKPGAAGAPQALPSRLKVRLNPAGIIPVVLATWVIVIVTTLLSFVDGPDWLLSTVAQFAYGRPAYWGLYAVLILVFVFFYTAFLLDPLRTAQDIDKRGGSVADTASLDGAAQHLDHAVSRVALMGALYLVIVCVVPEVLIGYTEMPFYVGGISLLVVVCTVIDLVDRVRAHAG
jgi:preprotein translocase subunit SecY